MPVFNQNTVATPGIDGRPSATGIPSIIPSFKPLNGINIPDIGNDGSDKVSASRPKFFSNSFVEANAFPQISSFYEAKKYPTFDPFRDNEDLYARNQGFWKSVGNGLGRLVLTAGTKLGTGVGYLAGLVGFGNNYSAYGDDFSGWLAGAGDNALAKWFEHVENETIKTDWFPIYQEAKDRNKGFFSRAATDLNFWTSDVVDGAAFMASAFIPAAAVSKLGMGAKAVRGLAALREMTAVDEGLALSEEGLAGTSEKIATAAQTTENINGLEHLPRVLSWIDNAKLARNIDVGTTAFINTASESMFEASQVKDNVYNSLIGQRDKYTGKNIYTPDQARQIAAKSAKDTYVMNLGALSLSNLWEANLFFKKLPATAGSTFLGKVATKGLLEDAELAKQTFGKNILYFVNPIAQGIGVEGLWEENIQLAIQRLNQGDENFDLNFTDKLSRVGKNYINQTLDALAGNDLEAAENIGIGGLIGAIAGKAFHVGENAQLKNRVANLNSNISFFKTLGNIYQTNEDGKTLKLDNDGNPQVDTDKIKSFVASANKILTLQEIATNLESRGQHALANIYKDELFARFAKAHFDSGLSDLLYQKLNDIQNIKPEDLISLGFDPNLNKIEIAEIANNLREQTKALESLYNSVQENSLPLKKDKGGKKSYDIKNKLFYLSARAQSLARQKNKAASDYEKVKSDIDNFDASFNSESDSVHDEYNKLFERLEAAKRNKDRVQSEKEYFAGLAYPSELSDFEQNGISVQLPKSRIAVAEESGVAVTTPTNFNEQSIDDEIQVRQKELDAYAKENTEVLNRLTKDSRGRYLYEIRNKNLLPSAKEMERQEIIQAEMEFAHNATINVMSRLADLRYGEKYYDSVYGPALQRHAEENNIFQPEDPEPSTTVQPIVSKAPNPKRVGEDAIDLAYDQITKKESVDNKNAVVSHIADKINNGEELSEKEQVLRENLKKEVDEELIKTAKDNEELFDKINELENEKQAIENKTEPDVEDQARKDQIDKQLEELRQQLEDHFDEENIVDDVENSSNIKPEDKEQYKEVLIQIARNKKLVKSTPQGWVINGQLYRKVTALIGDEIPDEIRDKVQNAINAGFTIDSIVKAYFDGTLNVDFRMQVQDKISSQALDKVIKNLDRIKKKLRDKGIEIVASNVMTWDEETKIAGEIDILGVDRNGNFKIYEVQARRPDVYRMYGLRGMGIKIREVDSKRLSAYRNLFANQYRVVPDEIAVMFPFQVKYEKGDSTGYIEDALAKESIRFLPTNLVEIKRKLLTPVRKGSKFDVLDMLHIFGDAFLTSDTAKAKFRFILRNVPFAELRSKMILSVRKAEQKFQDRYAKQEQLLHGTENDYKPTKYKGFENLYSLVGDHELSLKYDGTVIGYLSPSPALAYKDAEGKFKVLNENVDEQTYTETTGNSKQTFSDFKHIASAYSGAYNYLMKRLGESDGVDIDGDELNNLFDVRVSYGELDKVGVGEQRPDLKDLAISGVKVGNKVIPIVVHINSDDSIKVVTDKTAKKGKTVYRKLQELDRWANNNIENILAAITNKDGRRSTEYLAIVETPNKEYRILAVKNKGKFNIDIYDDFVPDLGSKFTAAVSKNVFKNENIVVVPKYNEENINVDLEDKLIAQTYPTEDAKALEKFGIHPSELDDKQAREIAENFLSSLTDEQRNRLFEGEQTVKTPSVPNSAFDELRTEYNSRVEFFKSNGASVEEAQRIAWSETPGADQYSATVMFNGFSGTTKEIDKKMGDFIESNPGFNPFDIVEVGQKAGQVDQLLQDYQNSEWADINDFLNNLKECKL